MAKIDPLLLHMLENNASDLHLVLGQPPKYGLHGHVKAIEGMAPLAKKDMEGYLFELISKEQRDEYLQTHDLDFSYGIEGQARYRCNYFFQRTGYGAVYRLIPSKILTIEELKLPPIINKLTELRSGLVLVTGPTGSGKTTTLAAMIDYINHRQRRHILTIEDPIEFVHKNDKSIISQREVGAHTDSFASALRGVSRQDADVVLVGELRDLETIGLALTAAAMGTLVYGTLHTNSAAKTIDRIIDIFPIDQQPQIRTMLAESLRGIVAQQLLRTRDGQGRVAANEILLGNFALAAIIREGHIERIASVLQSGRREGMQLMDDALKDLVDRGVIEGRDAYMKAVEKRRFEDYAEDHVA